MDIRGHESVDYVRVFKSRAVQVILGAIQESSQKFFQGWGGGFEMFLYGTENFRGGFQIFFKKPGANHENSIIVYSVRLLTQNKIS